MAGNRKKLIDIFIKDFSPGSFTDYLGIRMQKFEPLITTYHINFTFKIPPHICLPVDNKPVLSASGAMALFDEYSSMCLMMKDRNVRGGVSVVLTTDLHSPCPANTDVTIITSARKIGKTIGFCDMKMVDKDDNLIASGSHVKYIDMGQVWDIMMKPSMIGFTMGCYDLIGERLKGTTLGDKLMLLFGKKEIRDSSPLSPQFSTVGAAFQNFGVRPLPLPTGSEEKNKCYRHSVQVMPHMCNYFGKLHGGAAAMVAEYCARQATIEAKNSNTIPHIVSMEVKYLSPMTKDLVILASPLDELDVTNRLSYGEIRSLRLVDTHQENGRTAVTKSSSSDNGSSTIGDTDYVAMRRVDDTTLCAQFKCRWSH